MEPHALVYSYWGEPKGDISLVGTLGSEPVGHDGVAWADDEPVLIEPPPIELVSVEPVPVEPTTPQHRGQLAADRSKHCRAKDDTCMGWRIAGSDYCSAHSGLLRVGNPGPRSAPRIVDEGSEYYEDPEE